MENGEGPFRWSKERKGVRVRLLKPFKVHKSQRLGIERAARWHEYQAEIFRESVKERVSHALEYGEQQMKVEEHLSHARSLRNLFKNPYS